MSRKDIIKQMHDRMVELEEYKSTGLTPNEIKSMQQAQKAEQAKWEKIIDAGRREKYGEGEI